MQEMTARADQDHDDLPRATRAQQPQDDLQRPTARASANIAEPTAGAKAPGGSDPLGKKENLLAPFYDDMQAVAHELAPQFTPLGLAFRPQVLLATALQEASASDPLNAVSFDNGMGIMQITPYNGQLDGAVARAIGWDNRQSVAYNMQHSNWRDARANLTAGAYTMLGKAQSIKGSVPNTWAQMDERHRWRAVLYAYNAGQGAAIKALRTGGPNAAMISTFTDNHGRVVSHDYTAELQQKLDYVEGHDPFGGGEPGADGGKDPGGQAPGTSAPDTRAPQPASGGTAPTQDLRRGEQGAQVLVLQRDLVQLGYLTQADLDTGPGIFGPRTERAVVAFQGASGLPTTGFFGPMSRAAMAKALGGGGAQASTSSEGQAGDAGAIRGAPSEGKAGSTPTTGGAGPATSEAIPDAEQAIRYAEAQVKGTNPIAGAEAGTWAYYCLGLVQLAYGGRHAGLNGVGDAFAAWGRYAGKAHHDYGNTPRGALVFWDWTSAEGQHWGHIGIGLGGDRVISTSARTGGVATTSITGFGLPLLGWAAP